MFAEFLAGLTNQPSPGMAALSAEYMAGAPQNAQGPELAQYLSQSPIPNQQNTGINYLLEKAGAEQRLAEQDLRFKQARVMFQDVARQTGDTAEAYRQTQMMFPEWAAKQSAIKPSAQAEKMRMWKNLTPEQQQDEVWQRLVLGSSGVTIHNAPKDTYTGPVRPETQAAYGMTDEEARQLQEVKGELKARPTPNATEARRIFSAAAMAIDLEDIDHAMENINFDELDPSVSSLLAMAGTGGDLVQAIGGFGLNAIKEREVLKYSNAVKRFNDTWMLFMSGTAVPVEERKAGMKQFHYAKGDNQEMMRAKFKVMRQRLAIMNRMDPKEVTKELADKWAAEDKAKLDAERARIEKRNEPANNPNQLTPEYLTNMSEQFGVSPSQIQSKFDDILVEVKAAGQGRNWTMPNGTVYTPADFAQTILGSGGKVTYEDIVKQIQQKGGK
jgi:hypothetical protein